MLSVEIAGLGSELASAERERRAAGLSRSSDEMLERGCRSVGELADAVGRLSDGGRRGSGCLYLLDCVVIHVQHGQSWLKRL
jgi:hypothetical protein